MFSLVCPGVNIQFTDVFSIYTCEIQRVFLLYAISMQMLMSHNGNTS